MKKFEYKKEACKMDVIEFFNKHGKEGWEYCGYIDCDNLFYFKREIV